MKKKSVVILLLPPGLIISGNLRRQNYKFIFIKLKNEGLFFFISPGNINFVM